MWLWMTLAVCFYHVALTSQAETLLRVTSPSGTYIGRTLATDAGKDYKAFRGIPYAEPPVGSLRFKPPVPKAKLDEDYDATELKPFCVQMAMIPNDFGPGQEDCLYVNVFTPPNAGSDNSKLLKVFVFIHGGGNQNGFSNFYNPASIVAQHDIIVVTLNYRLGLLGFMSTENSVCPGNYGLWDQVEALRWVKENIRPFGGDPEAITVGGESAGGMDTSLLTVCSQSRGLFKRAFPMSGTTGVEHPMIMGHDSASVVLLAARRENCSADDASPQTDDEWAAIVECLKGVPGDRFGSLEGLGDLPFIGPVVDGDLIPRMPKELFSDAEYLEQIGFNERDYLVSIVYNEGDLFTAIQDQIRASLPPEQLESLPEDFMFQGLLWKMLSTRFGAISPEVVQRVREYYEANFEVGPLADYIADAMFHIPNREYMNAASEVLASTKYNVYMLRFMNFPDFMAGPYKGTCHGIDLGYLFDIDPQLINKIVDYKVDSSKWSEADEMLKMKYQALLASFVNNGRPSTYSGDQDKVEVDWPPYDSELGHYLVFNESPRVEQNLKAERMELWHRQIPQWIKEMPVPKESPKEEL